MIGTYCSRVRPDPALQIDVGRCHDSGIHFSIADSTDRSDLAVLEDARQLGLQIGRQIAYGECPAFSHPT